MIVARSLPGIHLQRKNLIVGVLGHVEAFVELSSNNADAGVVVVVVVEDNSCSGRGGLERRRLGGIVDANFVIRLLVCRGVRNIVV